jgi:hypothetical protein
LSIATRSYRREVDAAEVTESLNAVIKMEPPSATVIGQKIDNSTFRVCPKAFIVPMLALADTSPDYLHPYGMHCHIYRFDPPYSPPPQTVKVLQR